MFSRISCLSLLFPVQGQPPHPQHPKHLGPNRLGCLVRFPQPKGTSDVKDPRMKGLKEAMKNAPQRINPRHDWSKPWNSRCLCPGCDSPVYHDGRIYWSLCLKHLQELELGPFFQRPPPVED